MSPIPEGCVGADEAMPQFVAIRRGDFSGPARKFGGVYRLSASIFGLADLAYRCTRAAEIGLAEATARRRCPVVTRPRPMRGAPCRCPPRRQGTISKRWMGRFAARRRLRALRGGDPHIRMAHPGSVFSGNQQRQKRRRPNKEVRALRTWFQKLFVISSLSRTETMLKETLTDADHEFGFDCYA